MKKTGHAHRIGSLAALSGVAPDTVRFYERQGLLPRPARTAGGFRVYDREAPRLLHFIKQARTLGLTLREIRDLVQPDTSRCADVRRVIADRLMDVDARLRELRSFRRMLRRSLAQCDRSLRQSKKAVCPVAGRLTTSIGAV